MISWITSFLTPTPDSQIITADGRKSSRLLKFQEHGADEELVRWPSPEKGHLGQTADEHEEEARPLYLHVSGQWLLGYHKIGSLICGIVYDCWRNWWHDR